MNVKVTVHRELGIDDRWFWVASATDGKRALLRADNDPNKAKEQAIEALMAGEGTTLAHRSP